MTDEEILFDFFTIERNREVSEEEHMAQEDSREFVLDPVRPGEPRTFEVRSDRKEFGRWFKEQTGLDMKKYL